MQSNFWAGPKNWIGTKHFGTCKRTRHKTAKTMVLTYIKLQSLICKWGKIRMMSNFLATVFEKGNLNCILL